MLLIVLRNIFIIIALWLFASMAFRKLFAKKINDNIKASEYVAFIGFLIVAYVIAGLILMLFVHGWGRKFWIILFSLSPFILGKFATYEKEEIYSFIQMLVVVGSVAYVNCCT